MLLTTNKFSNYGKLEITFEIDPHAMPLAGWLIEFLESKAGSEASFSDGQNIELGWTLLQLRQADNRMELYEPDFDAFPIRWKRGVNTTIRHLYLQKSICDLFSCEPEFPSIRQSCVVSPRFAQSTHYTMRREHFSNFDSGWEFAEFNHSGSEGELLSLYGLALQNVSIVPFLALPIGAVVNFSPRNIEVELGGKAICSLDNALLQNILQSSILV